MICKKCSSFVEISVFVLKIEHSMQSTSSSFCTNAFFASYENFCWLLTELAVCYLLSWSLSFSFLIG